MSTDKSRTCWDERCTRIFLEQCIDQILKKERKGGSFTATGWINIIYGFYRNSGKSLRKKQLKNSYDCLKKEWRVWDKLFSKETGISYDSVNHKVLAEDEWWDRKVQENPDYAKYRYHGIKFARELEMVFKDGVLSGSTPDDKDDVYRPTMDLEEGSGDSEEELPGATTGVSATLEGLNLTTSTQPSAASGSPSIGKRKRGMLELRIHLLWIETVLLLFEMVIASIDIFHEWWKIFLVLNVKVLHIFGFLLSFSSRSDPIFEQVTTTANVEEMNRLEMAAEQEFSRVWCAKEIDMWIGDLNGDEV
ncbi:hypothetical protein K1719_010099 [Acacia pycnantha]|nr:hypothetical protein K1719_010099 [Acacia pycnantha]